ncbi:DUF4190 domain-containing protein [Blastococcus sp. CCUG 61487]|uniref:DUF4190 domain-containing protein n=1 Tax=Blastococcus sp. CCUG 61487 TaxID=1840703 RepID=UPI0010C0E108|nr:DUF4190 domain-containing protein [Blastococcus sp. CCUG 61487]TKJ34216.1 hypothetical protein A6V29_15240 [Blastococcus sp. CCUG 61487]
MSSPDDGARPAPGQPPYGPPGYPPPQYGQQYGQPPHAGAPYPPPAFYGRPTNSLAIVALILSLTFAPAGLITGIIARRQIKRTGEDGDGLALAAVIVGGIVTAFFVLMIVIWIIAVIALANDGFAP